MRFTSVNILGLGSELGDLEPVQAAIDRGEYTEKWAEHTGQLSTSVAELSGPELAVLAGGKALAMAALGTPELVRRRVGVHLHVCCYFQGFDLWPASCYVLNQLGGGGPVLTCQLDALSNGVASAVELAATMLTGRADLDTCLLTSGDRLCEPGFRRWSMQTNIVFGDAGAALVLGRRPGIAQVLSAATYCDPELEGMLRGQDPFAPTSQLSQAPPDMTARMRWFADQVGGLDRINERKAHGLAAAVRQALDDAGSDLKSLRWVVAPFYGRNYVRNQVTEPLNLADDQVDADLGLRTGHLGASDPVVGLEHLFATGRAQAGDEVLLLGIGVGYMWTALVVRVSLWCVSGLLHLVSRDERVAEPHVLVPFYMSESSALHGRNHVARTIHHALSRGDG